MTEETKKIKARSKEYPAFTLNQAIDFVKLIVDYPKNRSISYEYAAKEMGVKADTKSFRYMISSARQYGLLSTSSGNALSLSESAHRLARPFEDEETILSLKKQCFETPKLYRDLISIYKEKSIPDVDRLSNMLVNSQGIVSNVATTAAQVFIDTANEVGAIKSGILILENEMNSVNPPASEEQADSVNPTSRECMPSSELMVKEGFDAPLSIPFGEQKKAVLYMPLNVEKNDAEYALAMIRMMFKKVYGVDEE